LPELRAPFGRRRAWSRWRSRPTESSAVLAPRYEVEVVDHDPGPRQLVVDRLAVGLVGVDRDDLDRAPVPLGQRAQVALDPPP
jgi:hypothetical protein